MYYIHSLNLAERASLPALSHIVRRGAYLVLAAGAQHGELLTPAVTPRLAHRWAGFEVWPDEGGVSVALFDGDSAQPYQFADGAWIPAAAPVAQPPEQVRQRLPQWSGPLQVGLFVERQGDGRSPRIAGVKLGYEVATDLLSYAIEFPLAERLRQPVQLSRWVEPDPDRRRVSLPAGIVAARASQPVVMVVPAQAMFTGSVGPEGVDFAGDLPPGAVQLIFDYAPAVEVVRHDGYIQISEVPSLLVQLLELEPGRSPPARYWVRTPRDRSLVQHSSGTRKATVEVTIIATTDAEAWAIARQLEGRLRQSPYLELPGFDLRVPLAIRRGIQPGPGSFESGLSPGNLSAVGLRLVLLGLPASQWQQEVPLVMSLGSAIEICE